MISVCMATYNGGKYIKEQVDSILKQLLPNDELVISDDGSTDNTIDIIKNYNDNRIKIVYNQGKKGYTKNFENAIKNAQGDFIFMSDQDDVWNDDKVSKTISYLKKYDMVVSDASFVDADLKELNYTFFNIRGGRNGFWINLYQSQYLGACMAFKKNAIKKLLPFPDNSKLCPHDLWITLIGELYFDTGVIKEPLIKYRRHGQNVSTGGTQSSNSILVKIGFRIYCLIKVTLRGLGK